MYKRFYWLKLNENFFEREEIKVIESMKNGKDYIIFYLKLLLKSISTEGRLLFRNIIPYTPEMLAAITNTDIDTVRVAIDLFSKLNLMEVWDDGTLFMVETQNMIGSETDSAKRVRKHRERKALKESKESKMLQSNAQSLQCNGAETKSNTDIEIDIDKEIDIEEIVSSGDDATTPYEKIVDAYNAICKSLPKVQVISDKRKKKMRTTYRDVDKDFKKIETVFQKAEMSDFLSGRNGKWNGCNFDWLINYNNFLKVLEGTYDNKKADNSSGSSKYDNLW